MDDNVAAPLGSPRGSTISPALDPQIEAVRDTNSALRAAEASLLALSAYPVLLASSREQLRDAVAAVVAASPVDAPAPAAAPVASPLGSGAFAASLSAALRDVDAAPPTAPPAAAAAPPSLAALPPAPPPTLEDVAPYVAQTGHHGAADVLARLTRHLRSEERVWRAISRLALGLFRRTRIAAAARCGDVARCAFLLAHGADARVCDAFGRTPLDEAVAGGHTAAAAVLRAAGAVDAAPFGGAAGATWGPEAADPFMEDEISREVWSLAVVGGERIAAGFRFGAIRVLDSVTGVVVTTLTGHAGVVSALVALPVDRFASAGADSTVRLWSLATGTAEAVLAGHTDEVWDLAVLRDGRLASGSDDGSVRLWDVRTRACTAVLDHGRPVLALAALPCGGVASSGGGDGHIVLWSAAGVRVADLGGTRYDGYVRSLVMLPDGRLAAGYGDVIRIWNLQSHALSAVLCGHMGAVYALAPLPDGRLLSGSADSTLKVWDVLVRDRGDVLPRMCAKTCVLVGLSERVTALLVLPDRRVLSGDEDGSVRVLV